MTKDDYLDMRGFSKDDWIVLTKDESAPLLEKQGAINCMYPAKESAAIKEFGKGAYIVKKSWKEKHSVDLPSSSEIKTESSIPPPPPIPKAPEKEEKIESSFLCDRFENTGEECEAQCKFCERKENSNENAVEQVNKDIAEAVEKKSNKGKILSDLGFSLREGAYSRTIGEHSYGVKFNFVQNCTEEQFQNELENINDFIKDANALIEKAVDDVVDSGMTTNIRVEDVVENSETTQELVDNLEDEFSNQIDTETITDENLNKEIEVVEPKTIQVHSFDKEDLEEKKPKEISSVSDFGFFSHLLQFGFQQLNFTINKLDNGKINLILKPNNFSGDPAYDDIKPLSLTGTAEELDKEFFKVISEPLGKLEGLMSNAKEFIEAAEAKEKETKAKKEAADKIKKDFETAKKFYEKDGFDIAKSGKTALKKFNAVLEQDSKHKEALEYIDKINEDVKKYNAENESTLNF